MIDDELRTLERAVVTGGVAERLAFVRALDRAGRSEQATEVLAAARHEPLILEELARRGVWVSDRDGTRFSGDRSFDKEPRVRWETLLAPNERGFNTAGHCQLVLSPLGLASVYWKPICPAQILDLDTGRVRFRWEARPGPARRLGAAAAAFVEVTDSGIESRDPWSGESRELVPLASPRETPYVGCGLVAVTRGRETRIFELGDGSRAEATWSLPRRDARGAARIVATRDTVFHVVEESSHQGLGDYVAHDRKTGAQLSRHEGALVALDDLGSFAQVGPELVARDPSGSELWSRSALTFLAASPTTVALRERRFDSRAEDTLFLERATGREVGRAVGLNANPCSVIVGDSLVAVLRQPKRLPDVIAGVSFSGEVRWRFPLERESVVIDLAAYRGALYVLTGRATIVCLEETRP